MAHNHSHTTNYNKAFAIGIILNSIYIVIEFTYGIIFNSMALVADAGHNLSDVAGLLIAWGATYLAGKAASSKKTYGYKKTTILASLLNGIILMIAVGAIAYEAITRFFNPLPVPGTTIIIVASIGVVINTITALLFIKGMKDDLNIKGAFLHMAADAGVSVGVVIGGVIINATGFYLIDPILSIIIVIIITIGTWGLLKESFNLTLDSVPEGIKLEDVKNYIASLDGVNNLHDLHIWAMSTTETALTAHIVTEEQSKNDQLLKTLNKGLHDKFGIAHTTIQLENNLIDDNCNGNCN
ncbi:MAG: cation transporter [Ignavibacteriae bacterium]|nr:cation transporter [Ignavibacteriota bacterium]NOG98037.1 cation transporter [Ignavibacteriota bacterium]